MRWALAIAMSLGIGMGGCDRDEHAVKAVKPVKKESTVSSVSPQLELEGIPLLASLTDLVRELESKGWSHNAQADGGGDQRVTVFPGKDHPVQRFRLVFEGGVLIGVTASYKQPDPGRIAAMKARFSESRHSQGGWAMTDSERQVLVQMMDDGSETFMMHAGRARDRDEVGRMFRTLLGS